MDARSNTRHLHELDSLRGLAALSVVLGHYSNIFLVARGPYAQIRPLIETVRGTPLFVLMAGHEAVMLFFVLSGFVLSLQFFRPQPVSYCPFLIKRLFRIYVPYLIVLTFAVAACATFYSGTIKDLGPWFNHPWSAATTLGSIIDHVVFLGDFKSDQYDPVLWSLVQELRISLAFPLLMLIVIRLDWRQNLLFSLGLSIAGICAALLWTKLKGYESETGWCKTFHYAGVFILGIVLARHRGELISWYRNLSFNRRAGIGLAGFTLYCFAHRLGWKWNYFQDIPIAWGAALLVLAALGSTRLSALLHLRPIKFLGRVSYSLYLLHAVILLALIHLLYGRVPIGVILFISIVMSLLLSHLAYEWIESPAMRAGRTLAERWARTETPATAGHGALDKPETPS